MDTSGAPKPSNEAVDLLCDIDACCDRFEAAWAEGEEPSLEVYLAEAPAGLGDQLLRELLAIELEYRRDSSGGHLNAQQIIELHPSLDMAIAEEFCHLSTLRAEPVVSDDPTARVVLPEAADRSGLHIRCPHCQSAVELLDDTPLGDITCRECGSNFTLVERENDAPARGDSDRRRISRFELLEVLGTGAFGAVWKAYDTDLDRLVALKIPRRGQLRGAEAELFLREARAAAQLRHPNIVPVHEVGRDGDTLFIVSDLIHGATMTEWIKQPPPDFRKSAAMLASIAGALHAAHERGVIHRDLKPSNVMVDESGSPHLMDFGLAKRQTGEVTMTVDGQVLGTPSYMSPEQAAGEAHWIDRRSDIYSLGVMLFEVLTGDLPFRGAIHSQLQQRMKEDAPNPQRLNGRVPQDLATICLKCLERTPNRRFATAKEVADELRRFIDGEPIVSRPISRAQRAWRWARRNPYVAAALAMTALLAIAGPTAAVVIYDQGQRLTDRLQRELSLIQRADQQSQQSLTEIRELKRERDALIDASPDLSDAPDDVRFALVRNYLESHYEAASAEIASLPEDSPLRARAECGLARLLLAAGRADDATEHFMAAHRFLSASQSTDVATTRLLADCSAQLSDLLARRGNRDAAARYARQTLQLRAILTADAEAGIAQNIDLLESTVVSLHRQAGIDSTAPSSLQQVKAARDKVYALWQIDPQSVIALADAIANRPAPAPVD